MSFGSTLFLFIFVKNDFWSQMSRNPHQVWHVLHPCCINNKKTKKNKKNHVASTDQVHVGCAQKRSSCLPARLTQSSAWQKSLNIILQYRFINLILIYFSQKIGGGYWRGNMVQSNVHLLKCVSVDYCSHR